MVRCISMVGFDFTQADQLFERLCCQFYKVFVQQLFAIPVTLMQVEITES